MRISELTENYLNDEIEKFMKLRKPRSGILWIGNNGPDAKKPQAMSAKEVWKTPAKTVPGHRQLKAGAPFYAWSGEAPVVGTSNADTE
jgi:hypothetical protein